jgi:hypothetical protein
MKSRSRATLVVVAVWACVAVGGLLLSWSNRHLNYMAPDGNIASSVDMGFVLLNTAMSFVYAAVGAIVVVRTRHVIGMLLLAIAITFPALGLTEQYALHGLVTAPGSLPGTTVVGLSTLVVAGVTTTSITLILLLFPSGSARSARWRWIIKGALVAAGLWAVSYALAPGPFNGPWNDYGVHVDNPVGIAPLRDVLKATFAIGVGASLLLSVAGVVCLVLRFRSSHGVERQQVKFLAYVGLLLFVLFTVQFVLGPVLRVADEVSNVTWSVFYVTLMLGIPLAVGAAVLRYRLYDIDRVISRTFSYAIVTIVLGGLYALIAVVGPSLFLSARETPDWLIALATLLAAAGFVPVRRRVQRIVDHRFNRSRYSAESTIQSFTTRLRDRVDIDELSDDLRALVTETMAPAHVSLWLSEHRR